MPLGNKKDIECRRQQRIQWNNVRKSEEPHVDRIFSLDSPQHIKEYIGECLNRIEMYPDEHPDRLKTLARIQELRKKTGAAA